MEGQQNQQQPVASPITGTMSGNMATGTSSSNVTPTGGDHKKVGPIILILVVVIVLIAAALYLFASKMDDRTLPETNDTAALDRTIVLPTENTSPTDSIQTQAEVKAVTNTSDDLESLTNDLDMQASENLGTESL